MALCQETQDSLGLQLAQTDLGNLCAGPDKASEKGMIYELLQNQLTIMQVLAEMNGMSPHPSHYKNLLPE